MLSSEMLRAWRSTCAMNERWSPASNANASWLQPRLLRNRTTFSASSVRALSTSYFLVLGSEVTPKSLRMQLLRQPLLSHNRMVSDVSQPSRGHDGCEYPAQPSGEKASLAPKSAASRASAPTMARSSVATTISHQLRRQGCGSGVAGMPNGMRALAWVAALRRRAPEALSG